MWIKVFKNGPSKICERQPLKKILLAPFLNTLTHMTLTSFNENFASNFQSHFDRLNTFYTFSLVSESSNSLMFSGSIEIDQWHEMG